MTLKKMLAEAIKRESQKIESLNESRISKKEILWRRKDMERESINKSHS